jgi:hypothetical protein
MASSEARLEAGEAAELAGLLFFLGGWLVSDGKALAASPGLFVDDHGYYMPRCARIWRASRSCSPARTGSGFSAADRAMRRDPVRPGPALDR